MTANSILEYILVFFGWMLNNAMWDILSSTGLYLLPLFFKGMGIWLKVREEGFDEGNKGMLSLPRLENSIYVSFVTRQSILDKKTCNSGSRLVGKVIQN